MSAAGRLRAPGPIPRQDVDPSAEPDGAEPDSPTIRRMYDEAMARAAVHAPRPLARYLAVLAAS